MVDRLIKALKNAKKPVFLGIGNELYPEDSFGPLFITELSKIAPQNWVLIDCFTAPENFIGKVIRLNPDLVIFVDSMNVPDLPSDLFFIPISEISDVTTGTHRVSFRDLGTMIQQDINAKLFVLCLNIEYLSGNEQYFEQIMKKIKSLLEYFITVLPLDSLEEGL